MSETWLSATASDLGRGIDTGDIDPVALTRTYLDAAQSHDLGARIYARLTAERALAEAQASAERAKLGLRRSVLDGVPISWKDLFDTAGTATEAGSALMKDRVPDRDAEVLRRATAAGSVCLGKTHLSEFAFSGLGLNPKTATPPCVNDLDAVAGGSSSGAAASVAFDIAAAGIGSDTGGSVRIPAAWNDLVGLKTTLGRLSVEGSVPLCAKFDTVGPLTRSVEDAAQLMAMMEGTQAVDLKGANVSGARLLVLDGIPFDAIRDAPYEGFQNAVERLARGGATIQHAEFPEVAEALAMSGTLFASEGYAEHGALIESNPDLMFAEILERFRSGKAVSAVDYLTACKRLDVLRKIWLEKTAGYDAVIMPTSPILPPNQQRLLTDHGYYVTENLLALRNTRIGNLFGNSALTVPTGVPSAGIMFLAAPFAEEKLLCLGGAAEKVLS